MATYSGKFDNSGYTLYLDVTESNVSVANNTSVVNWTLRIVSTKDLVYGSWDLDGTSYSVTIDGEKVKSGSKAYDFRNYKNLTVASGSKTITHNSDGSRSVSCSAKFGASSTPIGDATASGTFALSTIPRASEPSVNSYPNNSPNFNIGDTITIHMNRKSNIFTHNVYFLWGSINHLIASNVTDNCQFNTGTIASEMYKYIPNDNVGVGSIKVDTYNGSTLVGSATCEVIGSVVNSNPIVGSFSYIDSNSITTAITKNNQRIIRENSNLLFTVGSATPQNSASISKYEISFNGIVKSRTSAGDLDFGTINLSSNANATLTVIDSRGNSASANITVIIDDWILPKGLISLNRKNNFYSETYLKVDSSYSSLNGKNSLGIQYQCKKINDKNFSVTGSLQDNVQKTLDLDNEYEWYIEIILTDRIGQTTYSLVLNRGMPIIFFDRMKSSVGVNCFPSAYNNFEVNGYEYSKATSEDNLTSFNGVGEGEPLNKSGFYTICEYANGNGTWYNLINVRHRNGQADGTVYGMQLRNRLIGYTDKLQVRQQNNGNWGSWRNIQEEPVTLFENAGGTTDNITLSENAGNFQFMEIFYVDNNGRSNKSVRVHSPQLKNIELSCIEPAPDNSPARTYIRSSLWVINGTSITHDKSTFTTLSSDGVTVTNNQYIKIYRVVGYR